MGALSKAAETVDAATRPGPPCSVGVALSAMDAEDQATLLGWVQDGRQWNWMSAVMREAGVRISGLTLSRHFRGGCRCDG